MADPLKEYVEPSSIFADREKLPPQKFGDDNYENMVNYIMRNGTIGQNEYAEAGLNDLSWRQRTADGVASAAEYLGMKPYEARKFAGNLTGDMNQGIADGFGIADITPAGLVFGANEAYRDFKIADSPTDYIAPVIGGAFAAAEAFPLTKAMTRPAFAWLKSITSKAAIPRSEKVDAIVAADKVQDNLDEMITGEIPRQQYDDDGVLGNLPEASTINRREVIGGLAALGATAPAVKKVAKEVAPVVKKVTQRSFGNAPIKTPWHKVKSFFDELSRLDIEEAGLSGESDRVKQEFLDARETDSYHKDLEDAYYWFKGGAIGEAPNYSAGKLADDLIKHDPQEIADMLGSSGQLGSDVFIDFHGEDYLETGGRDLFPEDG